MKRKYAFLAIIMSVILFTLTACTSKSRAVSSENLMKGVKAEAAEGKNADDAFLTSTANFSLKLFQQGLKDKKNSLISPTSVLLALSMTANGAEGNTLEEFQKLLGDGISIEALNNYIYSYLDKLPNTEKEKLNIANSIWFRDSDSFTVQENFLKTNATYYNASIYKSDFDSEETIKDINGWVEKETHGMIDKIINKIDPDSVMFLINALAFEGEWQRIYEKADIVPGEFSNIDDTNVEVDFMNSAEASYIEDSKVTGFLKPYKDANYSFVAMLPKEGIDINEYIDSLSGEDFLSLINSSVAVSVRTSIPKFSYEYELSLKEPLENLGLVEGFNSAKANFKGLGSSSDGNIYIGEVLHKTFIQVDERGTKAGAVTSVEMKTESAILDEKYVTLDRPFVYAIIDNETKLPIFIGTVMELTK
ncbi:serpin family protein [Alloiococcus sp. CFN-8]|uniref:serpin family protein n=1 Tax=Alloiococcus sp. CFN-8 TaxID=3416081 RepID=UPI003CFB9797